LAAIVANRKSWARTRRPPRSYTSSTVGWVGPRRLSAAIPIKQQQFHATNQPRGRGVGAVPGLAGYGTPWVSGFRVSWPASPLSQGQPTSIINEEDSLQ
jgi:hypothetical protein